MAGGTDNNQLKLAAKTRWWWRQQFVDDDKDNNDDEDEEHNEHKDDNDKDGEHDNKDDEDDEHDDGKHNNDDHNDVDDDDDDNKDDDDDDDDEHDDSDSDSGQQRQRLQQRWPGAQTTINLNWQRRHVAVETAMETAAAGTATTATSRQGLPWALAQMESPSPPPGRVVGAGSDGYVWGCACWLCVCCAPLLFC
jgi:hypothetical protein